MDTQYKMAISEDTFEILRTAITMARNEQIKTINALHSRLGIIYPDKDSQITEAISLLTNSST